MIKSVEIKNYQKHKNLKIHFKEGLNVIYGNTDAGKSAVIRAVYWVLFNRPGGNDNFTEGTKETSVKIKFDDGTEVSRIRSTTKNMYILNDQEFHAVGMEVPEPVKEALNFSPYNFQGQFDPVFMLGPQTSSGEVARVLNEVSNLSVIDSSLKNIASMARKKKSALENHKTNIAGFKSKITEYPDLEEMRERVLQLLEKEESLKTALNSKKRLERYIESYNEIKLKTKRVSLIVSAKKQVLQLEELAKKKKELESRKNMLDFLIGEYKKASEVISRKKNILKARKTIESILKLEGEKKIKFQQIVKFKNYLSIKTRIAEIKSDMKEIKSKIPNICPTCGQAVKL